MIEVTEEILKQVNLLADLYRKAIVDSGHSASGKLENFTTSVSVDGKWFNIYFNVQDYWKYLENGTRPHWPPISAIERWIQVKPIIPRAINNRVPTTRQLAFLIARKISKVGTPKTELLHDSLYSNAADQIINTICDLIVQQIEEEIKKETDEIS